MLTFSKEIPAKAVELRVDEINISMANKMVYINVNDGDSNRVEAISLLDIFKSEDTVLIEALKKVVSTIIDIKYEVDTSLSKGDLFKETENELVPDFVQPTGAHDAYNIGDKVKFDGVVYISLIDANVWHLNDYPAGWQLN